MIRGGTQTFFTELEVYFLVARPYKVSSKWVKIKTLHLHVLLFLNHSKVVITRSRSKSHINFFFNWRNSVCVVSVLPSFSIMSFCHCNPNFYVILFSFSIFSKQNNLTFISVMWNICHTCRLLHDISLKSLNSSQFRICSRQWRCVLVETVLKLWTFILRCRIHKMSTTINESMAAIRVLKT